MRPKFTLTAFTPSEAAAITGVSPGLQRDWRRRGYLESREGHARFDAFDLASMMAVKMLADRGIGPKETATSDSSGSIADWCAQGICIQAFQWSDAWEGDHALALKERTEWFSGLPENAETEAIITEIISSSPEAVKTIVWAKDRIDHWKVKADYLSKRLFHSLDRPLVRPGSRFIWWANGEHFFHTSVDAAINDVMHADPKTAGPVVVLAFDSLATILMDRAGRALCHVAFEDEE